MELERGKGFFLESVCAFCYELIIYRSGLLWDECCGKRVRFVTSCEATGYV